MELSRLIGVWNRMPKAFRETLLSKIWCPRCRNFSTVNAFTCRENGDDLYLCGRCTRCGEKIERPVPVCDM